MREIQEMVGIVSGTKSNNKTQKVLFLRLGKESDNNGIQN